MVTSFICIISTHCFMLFTGQGEPAMMPVRSEEKLNRLKSGCSRMAMNMVGTP